MIIFREPDLVCKITGCFLCLFTVDSAQLFTKKAETNHYSVVITHIVSCNADLTPNNSTKWGQELGNLSRELCYCVFPSIKCEFPIFQRGWNLSFITAAGHWVHTDPSGNYTDGQVQYEVITQKTVALLSRPWYLCRDMDSLSCSTNRDLSFHSLEVVQLTNWTHFFPLDTHVPINSQYKGSQRFAVPLEVTWATAGARGFPLKFRRKKKKSDSL